MYEGAVLEKMRWSKPLGPYDDQYYEQATFVLVKESPNAIRIKLIDKYRKDYDGLVFWMPKKITKSYNNSDPNIKTAWFWEKAFNNNATKALSNKKNDPVTRLDFLDVHTYKSDPTAWRQGVRGKDIRGKKK
jgi:hypothetical protein